MLLSTKASKLNIRHISLSLYLFSEYLIVGTISLKVLELILHISKKLDYKLMRKK